MDKMKCNHGAESQMKRKALEAFEASRKRSPRAPVGQKKALHDRLEKIRRDEMDY